MTLTYNIPTQTVSLEMTPAEFGELTDLARTRVKQLFAELVNELRQKLALPEGDHHA